MTYTNAAVAYREREVLTASPAKLVVLVYDHLLVNLRRAALAIKAGNVDARVDALGRARETVMELLVTTDLERGGEIARNLRSLYAFVFNELVEVGRKPDASRLEKLAGVVQPLRDGFATIAAEAVVETPAA